MAERFHGSVIWFAANRGFGFIRRDDGEADVFLGARVLAAAGLTEVGAGDRLEFGLELGARGEKFRAVEIRVLPKYPARGFIGGAAEARLRVHAAVSD